MPNRSGKTITIRETDNTTTVKGRVTFPKGTRIPQEDLASSPSTAPVGGLSGGQGNLPGRPPKNPNNPASGAWANFTHSNIGAGMNMNPGVPHVVPGRPQIAPHLLPSGVMGLTPWENLQNQINANSQFTHVGSFGQVPGQSAPVSIPQSSIPLHGTFGQITSQPVFPNRGNPLNYGLNPSSGNPLNYGLGSSANTPQQTQPYYGTAGMYTYGQFSDPGEAFAALLDRGVPTNVPSYIADRFGMTAALQQPNSGWALQGNDWVQTPTSGAGGGTAGTTSGTGGTSPYAPNSGYTVQPTIPITNFQNTGGANNTDFTQTAYYQWAIANDIPFEQQTRWDPRTGRYISIEKYLKNEKDRKMKRGHWGGTNDTTNYGGGGSYYDYANPYNNDFHSAPSPFTGSWGVVNFNTGGG